MPGHLLGAGDVRALAEQYGVRPTKALGQNFVHDANTVTRIVRIAGVQAGERVLEIGPGLGSLTGAIVEADAAVVAVELDPVLATALRDRGLPGVEVIEADALRLDPAAIEDPQPTRLVANLPYNVSVPVLLRILETMPSIMSGVVMVQAEVGERLAAAAGSDAYGVPSAKAAWWAEVKLAGTVPRAVFWPVPNVDSVLVGFTRRPAPAEEVLRRSTFQAIDAAFAQRRKTLRSALAPWAGSPTEAERLLTAVGIDPKTRGERLDVAAYAALARAKEGATEPPVADA